MQRCHLRDRRTRRTEGRNGRRRTLPRVRNWLWKWWARGDAKTAKAAKGPYLNDVYRGLLYSAQNIVKKDPGRARQKSLATAQTNFTKPGAQNKGDLCTCGGGRGVPKCNGGCMILVLWIWLKCRQGGREGVQNSENCVLTSSKYGPKGSLFSPPLPERNANNTPLNGWCDIPHHGIHWCWWHSLKHLTLNLSYDGTSRYVSLIHVVKPQPWNHPDDF